ncbi:MAG: hypothetical protein JXN65_09275 [Clostridia bacterium]|nr:hypothetical protein [Clostridia bacterium]
MKNLILLAAILLAAVSFSSIVLAGNVYDIPELKLSAEVPDGWIAITRNADDNVAAEAALCVDSQALINYMEKSLIYLNLLKEDLSAEIFINKMEDENSKKVISINGFNDRQLNAMAEEMMGLSMDEIKESLESTEFDGIMAENIKWQGFEIYRHHQAVFIKLYFTKYLDGVATPSIQYSTIQNGQNINISISSYSDEISSSLEKTSQAFVDSIVFTEIQKGPIGFNYFEILKKMLSVGLIGLIVGIVLTLINKKAKKNNPDLTPENTYDRTNE